DASVLLRALRLGEPRSVPAVPSGLAPSDNQAAISRASRLERPSGANRQQNRRLTTKRLLARQGWTKRIWLHTLPYPEILEWNQAQKQERKSGCTSFSSARPISGLGRRRWIAPARK